MIGRLQPVIRTYDWGSLSAIPALLGIPETGAPMAEAWFGAHAARAGVHYGLVVESGVSDTLRAPGMIQWDEIAFRSNGTARTVELAHPSHDAWLDRVNAAIRSARTFDELDRRPETVG